MSQMVKSRQWYHQDERMIKMIETLSKSIDNLVSSLEEKSTPELGIISLEGEDGSYGHVVVNSSDVVSVCNIIIREKQENESYSVDSVVDRVITAGIKTYAFEYLEVGM